MEQAALQLRRLLAVIPHLANGDEHRLSEVAERLGVDAETVLRDLRALSIRFDEPGGFVEGVQIFIEPDAVSLFTDHFHRPMRLTQAELGALELGLSMLRRERPPEEHSAIDRARQRLAKALAGTPPDESSAAFRAAHAGASGDVRALALLRRAVRGRIKVRLGYRSGAESEVVERTVRPYALLAARGAWFAVAYCERASAVRVFRVDRIARIEAEGTTFDGDSGFSLEELVKDGRVFSGRAGEQLRVRYNSRIARWIAERERVALNEDGSVTVEYPLADEAWAVRHVLQYGPDAEVLEPARVRETVRETLSGLVKDIPRRIAASR